jgi:hypothetical protein
MLRDMVTMISINGELVKYNMMIKNSNKPFYHSFAAQYMSLFVVVKLF